MKYCLNIISFFLFFQLIACKSKDDTQTNVSKITSVKIEEKSYDFGTILQSDSITHEFRIKNTGNIPLIIKSAKAGCGCTIPKWDNNPITPNEYATIEVKYKPTKNTEGFINKSIVVQANTDSTFHVLYIKGNVLKKG